MNKRKWVIENELGKLGRIIYRLGMLKITIDDNKFKIGYRKFYPLNWLWAIFIFIAISIIQVKDTFKKTCEEMQSSTGRFDIEVLNKGRK